MADADKYNFQCEFTDEASQMTKEYLLTVFHRRTGGPNEISLFDTKAKRMFLKRGVYDEDGPMRLEDMYINGTVTICSRKMKIISYADSATRDLYARNANQVYTTIGSRAYPELGRIFSAAAECGWTIKRVKSRADPQGQHPAIHIEMVGPGSAEEWLQVMEQSLGSSVSSAITAETSGPLAEKAFAGKDTTATFNNCSLCIIRPHALREGQVGAIISALLDSGFEISCMQSYALLKNQAENFYEVYKTVIPSNQYSAMISELASGLCLALEVKAQEDVVPRLRELCGPFDVEIARHLRPNTIRAVYGRDNVHNCVHCTDLPEDGALECQYFFQIIPSVS
eukprot:TRINITY_DN14330_c1_g1_i1.p1 TRINITY_DN14330_c1_g1~~TRINITY_DN14330_c1_g1_i1.p1  ORF type:complete len:340 (+),score=69.93 TRINITY_DN14330_c1_g1_i1:64-1083(+)